MYRALNNTYLNNGKIKKTEAQLKGCLAKIGYDTEFEANVIGSKQRQGAYKCLYCSHWHLTSKV